eukprot:symbB.v1.2.026852.t1/scaffold2714.1/size94327/5
MLEIPTESDLGSRDVSALRVRFEVKNSFDYGLYNEAKRLSEIRVAKCAKGNPVIAKLRAAPVVKEVKKAPVQATPLTVDEMFGCTNGSLEMVNGTYLLLCRELVGGEKHLEFFSSLDLRPADEGAT